MQERHTKGRQPKGSGNGNHKVNETQVKEIRQKYATGEYTLKVLSKEYGLDQSTLSSIIHRRYWKHI